MLKKVLVGLGFLALSGGAALAQTPLSAGQVRAVLMTYGCSNTSSMSLDSKGGWHVTCWKGGAPAAIVVPPQGSPVADATASGEMSESKARVVLMNAGCTVSALSADSKGGWHAICLKGFTPAPMVVTSQGRAAADNAAGEMSEASARVVLTNYGCSNISTLDRDPDGSWHGACLKGALIPFMATVDSSGKVIAR